MYSVLVIVASECNSAGVAARALANIADVLACMAHGRGGMRSGPAANLHWKAAFELLEVNIPSMVFLKTTVLTAIYTCV